MIRILHLSSERTWRGGEQQIAYLIEELKRMGVTNYVACRKGSAFEGYCKKNNIPHKSLGFKSQYDIRTALGIKAYSKETKADIIHMHSSHGHALGVWSHLLGNKTPLILTRRVDFPINKNVLSTFKYNYKGIERIICISEKIQEITLPDIKEKDKCVTVHSGIDPEKFQHLSRDDFFRNKFKIPEDELLIGNTAAIADHKDYFTFIDTAELLLNKGLKASFLIIGDGPMSEEIKAYAQTKPHRDKIIFTGFIENVYRHLSELDIFLMTSKTEGLGTSVLDAFASKVPVVATAAGGIPEMIEHEITGLLAPIKDPGILAIEVRKLVESPDLQKKITENAFKKLQHFTKEAMAKGNLSIYKEVLDKKKPR